MASLKNEMQYGNNITQCRCDKNNMTQKELADKVGAKLKTIQSIESGKSLPSVAIAIKLARVLDKTVEEIFILK